MRVVLILVLALIVMGCAAPQGAVISYDPNILIQQRRSVASQWAADVAHRRFVEPYMNAVCAPDGQWAQMNAKWAKDQLDFFNDVLMKFEPIPNAPPGSTIDWGKLVEVLVSVGSKVVLGARPQSALPPGLPPC